MLRMLSRIANKKLLSSVIKQVLNSQVRNSGYKTGEVMENNHVLNRKSLQTVKVLEDRPALLPFEIVHPRSVDHENFTSVTTQRRLTTLHNDEYTIRFSTTYAGQTWQSNI